MSAGGIAGGGGAGGPPVSVDNAIVLWDGVDGSLIKDSAKTIGGAGGVATLDASSIVVQATQAVRTTTGPTTLTVGDIVDGEFVKRVGNTLVSASTTQTITLTGDVTGSGTGSFAATIANAAITYAKIQDVSAASRVIGRGSAGGAGDVEELTLGSNLSIAGTVLSAVGLSGTNTGDQTITLTGDVTGSGTGSFAATIANDSVTFAKMQDIETARLLGRSTAATGNIEELTVGAGLSLTGGVLSASSGSSITNFMAAGQTNTGTEADVTGWTGGTLVTGKHYKFTGIIGYSNNTASKLPPKFGLDFTNTPTLYHGTITGQYTDSSSASNRMVVNSTNGGNFGATASTDLTIEFRGTFKANGTTGGTCLVRVDGDTSNTVTLHAGGLWTLEQLD